MLTGSVKRFSGSAGGSRFFRVPVNRRGRGRERGLDLLDPEESDIERALSVAVGVREKVNCLRVLSPLAEGGLVDGIVEDELAPLVCTRLEVFDGATIIAEPLGEVLVGAELGGAVAIEIKVAGFGVVIGQTRKEEAQGTRDGVENAERDAERSVQILLRQDLAAQNALPVFQNHPRLVEDVVPPELADVRKQGDLTDPDAVERRRFVGGVGIPLEVAEAVCKGLLVDRRLFRRAGQRDAPRPGFRAKNGGNRPLDSLSVRPRQISGNRQGRVAVERFVQERPLGIPVRRDPASRNGSAVLRPEDDLFDLPGGDLPDEAHRDRAGRGDLGAVRRIGPDHRGRRVFQIVREEIEQGAVQVGAVMQIGPDGEPRVIEIGLRPERRDVMRREKVDQRVLMQIPGTVSVAQIDRRKDRRVSLPDIVEGRPAGRVNDRRAGGNLPAVTD